MKLLATQLANQDPLSPMENQEFVAQLAQFTNLEESQKTNKNLEELLTLQRLTQAGSLAGREVEFLGAEGRAETGRIDSVIVEGDAIGLSVDGRRLSPGSLIRIMANSEDASSAAALEEN
jgi:flagellar basal-body rod modification protein FlgD